MASINHAADATTATVMQFLLIFIYRSQALGEGRTLDFRTNRASRFLEKV